MKLGSEYVGVFVAEGSKAADHIVSSRAASHAECVLYVAANSFLGLVFGGHHAEDVTQVLDLWHTLVPGGSLVGATVTPRARPPFSSVTMYSVGLADLSESFLQVLEGRQEIFAVYDPTSGFVVMLAESPEELPVDSAASLPRGPRRFLFFRHSTVGPARAKTPTRYDPLAAQATETLRQLLPTLEREVQELQAIWKDVLRSEPEHLHRTAEYLNKQKETLLAALAPDHNPDVTKWATTLAASTAREGLRAASELKIQLSDYRQKVDPLAQTSKYSEGGDGAMLRAAKRLSVELAHRLGLDGTCFLPVYGDDFQLRQGLIIPDSSPAEIVIQRAVRHRLGALPLVAHLVAHLAPGADGPNQRQGAIKALKGEYGPFLRETAETAAETRVLKLQRLDWIEQHGIRLFEWWKEMAIDLAASATCGPAYVFAMARFVGDEPARPGTAIRMPLTDRIQICLQFLRSRGFSVQFASRFLPPHLPDGLDNLFDDIVADVRRPYSAAEDEDARRRVGPLLEAGELVRDPPTQVLNVLWHAVSIKGQYVNELAALASLACDDDG